VYYKNKHKHILFGVYLTLHSRTMCWINHRILDSMELEKKI